MTPIGTPAVPARPWKRVLVLGLWLCLAPPIGVWMVWQDKTLSTTAKWRMVIYFGVMPYLAYATLSLFLTSHAFMRMDS